MICLYIKTTQDIWVSYCRKRLIITRERGEKQNGSNIISHMEPDPPNAMPIHYR